MSVTAMKRQRVRKMPRNCRRSTGSPLRHFRATRERPGMSVCVDCHQTGERVAESWRCCGVPYDARRSGSTVEGPAEICAGSGVVMTALVTGAGGFIGGHLVGRLLDDGVTVRAVDVKPLEQWYQVH